MDKYEYKIRADEINELIAEGKFAEAVKIADTIDWRRVKSVMMLCKISDLYKINRRYPESRDILLLAYEKHPSRLIVYSLCELSIKMEEYVQAIEYYKEFVQIAPKDTGRYILQYRLYEAQDVSLEERIAVLEEFKKRDYREKWAYELAYLYHRIGLTTKCVEECDEMFLWFGEGKYVVKALELKKLHEPLNDEQQDKYELWIQARENQGELYEEEEIGGDYAEDASGDAGAAEDGGYAEAEENTMTGAELPTTELPEVKTVDVGQYNTINLQMALAESMKEILDEEETSQEEPAEDGTKVFYRQRERGRAAKEEAAAGAGHGRRGTPVKEAEPAAEASKAETGYSAAEDLAAEAGYPTAEDPAEESGHAAVKEPAAGVVHEADRVSAAEAVHEADGVSAVEAVHEADRVSAVEAVTERGGRGAAGDPAEESGHAAEVSNRAVDSVTEAAASAAKAVHAEEKDPPVEDTDDAAAAITRTLIAPLMEETNEMPDPGTVEKKLQETSVTQFPGKAQTAGEPQPKSWKPVMDTDNLEEISAQIAKDDTSSLDAEKILEQMKQEAQRRAEEAALNRVPGARTGVLTPLNTKPSKYDSILSQEYDGQISLVMPEADRIEKQITGQLSIEDIMAEWEEMKKTNEQKRMEDVRKRILEHTGDLFANFDEATKNGLLEELERAFVAAIMKETDKKPSSGKAVLSRFDGDKKSAAAKRTKPEPAPKPAPKPEEPDEEISAEIPEETSEEISEGKKDSQAEKTNVPADSVPVPTDPDSVGERADGDDIVSEEERQPESDTVRERELTEEERELFGEFIHHRKSERQLIRTLDNMSLAPYTGNVLITGEEEETTLMLAKTLIREMQLGDSNFSGRVAKISGSVLNKKNVDETFDKLNNGALIIEAASRIRPATAADIVKALDRDNRGLLVLMIDHKQNMNEFLAKNEAINDHFNLRVDIEALDDEALVAYARQYAEEMEYSIDEFGILALHTRIADMQTSDHEVNTADVRELVDEAIYYANKKTPGHFMDILLAKRYNEEDMIILREKDFMHN